MVQDQFQGSTSGRKNARSAANSAAVNIALPNNEERAERLEYLDKYSCKPPPLFLVIISLSQIGVFIYHAVVLGKAGKPVGPDGPAYVEGQLILDPNKRTEVWRYLTYMFVHSGYFHIVFNVLVQLMLGLPLEMVHRWWRVLLIYISGVLAGSLIVSITDPDVFLAGASGGVYSLITAHLANVIFNWGQMEFAALRLITFLVLAGVDIGIAVYYRYMGTNTKVSYVAHLAGALVGLLLGLIVLRNLKTDNWEKYIWWACLVMFLGLLVITLVWNAVLIL